MASPSLVDLLVPLGLTLESDTIDSLEWLSRELLRWNQTHNLTAIVDPGEVREKHIADSLTLLPLVVTASRLLDLGSGAGFPALPVKIARPELDVVTIESVGKKVAFQRHVARSLHLKGFSAISGRAETLPDTPQCRAGFDVITARALGSLPLLINLAAPCLAPGGRLIVMKGAEGLKELTSWRAQLTASGWSATCHELRLPVSAAERCLIVIERNM